MRDATAIWTELDALASQSGATVDGEGETCAEGGIIGVQEESRVGHVPSSAHLPTERHLVITLGDELIAVDTFRDAVLDRHGCVHESWQDGIRLLRDDEFAIFRRDGLMDRGTPRALDQGVRLDQAPEQPSVR